MMEKEKAIMCWSGGKDSTLALQAVLQENRFEVISLLTTLTEDYDRISMHGVRRKLLEQQSDAVGIPLTLVRITKNANNEEYEKKMGSALAAFKAHGVNKVIFGDIFLEDLKIYREKNLAKLGMEGIFPNWKQNTADLIQKFVEEGYKAVLTCIDTQVLAPEFAGKEINKNFALGLPSGVDPCGENGEFHTFVYGGPIFKNEVKWIPGQRVVRARFCFFDLLPENLN